MALTDDGSNGMVMPVAPYYANGGNNGSGFGSDDNGWWIILLFIILFAAGGWNNGYGNGAGGSAVQGALTRGDLCMDMNFQEVKREIQNANDAVNLGFSNLNSTICNQQYDTVRMINGIESQLAQCCCDIREGISGVNYNLAINTNSLENTMCNNTRDIIENQTNGTRAILDAIVQNKIEAKNDRIADLERQLTMANLNSTQNAQTSQLLADNARQTVAIEQALNPTPVPAYIVANPNCCNTCSTGCGCGSNF